MLQKVGLLPEPKFDQLKSTYATYEDDDKKVPGASAKLKETSIDVKVGFLGVWYVMQLLDQLFISSPCRDTVESVGSEKKLPFSRSSDTVEVFRHALSLDEHRVKFEPSFCTPETPKDQRTDVKEVFFAGVHCGTLQLSPLRSVRYS
jgi:uncharacterized protein (DUF2235 family)